MSGPILRPYQDDMLGRLRAALRVHRSVILQGPTGCGKGTIAAYMCAEAESRGLSVWLTCHRKELVDQLSGSLWLAGVQHGIIQSGRRETKDRIQVASIQTLVRRLGRLGRPNMVLFDEAHHATATTWRKVADHCGGSWQIGLTATPARTDGTGLDDLFDGLVIGPSVTELTEQGFLAPYRMYAPATAVDLSGVHTRGGDWVRSELETLYEQSAIVGDAVEHYRRFVEPGTCLVYCVSRSYARKVEAAYRAAGIDARYCAGDTERDERKAIVEGLRDGSVPVVVSVDLFGEGLDCPGLNAVQMLRHTQSLVLYLQMVGRALRPEPGKDHAIILDHVHNSLRHGLPDDDRVWTLEGRKRKRGSKGEAPIALVNCPECFRVFRRMLGACPNCGWTVIVKRAGPEEVDGELREIDKKALRRQRSHEERQAIGQGFEALVALAVARGYKCGWAAYRWAGRHGLPAGPWIGKERQVRREL